MTIHAMTSVKQPLGRDRGGDGDGSRPSLTRAIIGAFALLLVSSSSTVAAWAASRAELWSRWQANEPSSSLRIDHSAWDRFLAAFVALDANGISRVAYGRVASPDRIALRAYIQSLSAVPVSRLSRAEQLPYWINLYNALTVETVLEHYPVRSIRAINISPGWLSVGPWGRKVITIEGEAVSLDDIEHRILRPIWRDPRIHYALNCASLGCPNLQPRAFTADNTEALLEAAARAYVNHPRGARIENGRLKVSSIYVWYGADFGGTDASVLAHLSRYAEPELRAALGRIHRIDSDDYDWSLNDAR